MSRRHQERKGPIVDLFNEQSGLCCYCSEKMTLRLGSWRTATVEHILPRSSGGKDHFNRAAACLDCNQKRGNTPLLIYLAKRRWPNQYRTTSKPPQVGASSYQSTLF